MPNTAIIDTFICVRLGVVIVNDIIVVNVIVNVNVFGIVAVDTISHY